MNRPQTRHVRWNWEWREDEDRFHIYHFETDKNHRSRGYGSRALINIIEWAIEEKDAENVTIQMGGGAYTARWLRDVSSEIDYALSVEDVQGYEEESWVEVGADRVDGEGDKEGDEQSSVFATVDVGFLKDYYGFGQ